MIKSILNYAIFFTTTLSLVFHSCESDNESSLIEPAGEESTETAIQLETNTPTETIVFGNTIESCGGDINIQIYEDISEPDKTLSFKVNSLKTLAENNEEISYTLPNKEVDISIKQWDRPILELDYFCTDVSYPDYFETASWEAISGVITIASSDLNYMNDLNTYWSYTISVQLENVVCQNENGELKTIEDLNFETRISNIHWSLNIE